MSATTGKTVLELHEFSVPRGGRDVVNGVTIEVPDGEITALLGPNGAGKSSLVLAVAGAIKPSGGSVWSAVSRSPARPEKIRQPGVAIVPEGRRLLGDLTVDDNLDVATYTLSKEQAIAGRERAFELFPELEKRCRRRHVRSPAASSRWSSWLRR